MLGAELFPLHVQDALHRVCVQEVLACFTSHQWQAVQEIKSEEE